MLKSYICLYVIILVISFKDCARDRLLQTAKVANIFAASWLDAILSPLNQRVLAKDTNEGYSVLKYEYNKLSTSMYSSICNRL